VADQDRSQLDQDRKKQEEKKRQEQQQQQQQAQKPGGAQPNAKPDQYRDRQGGQQR
jgi:hypothetical protein